MFILTAKDMLCKGNIVCKAVNECPVLPAHLCLNQGVCNAIGV